MSYVYFKIFVSRENMICKNVRKRRPPIHLHKLRSPRFENEIGSLHHQASSSKLGIEQKQLRLRELFTRKMAEWDQVTYLKKKPMTAKEARSKEVVNAAMRKGQGVDTEKKYAAGTNKQHSAARDTAKLERETEELHHTTVSLDVGKLIQKCRMEKEWTQKDLATKINEKPQVINDYEAGRAIPNNQIMNKLERSLGVRLRGKEKGKPMQPKSKK